MRGQEQLTPNDYTPLDKNISSPHLRAYTVRELKQPVIYGRSRGRRVLATMNTNR
jgi:hypothetical protein